MYVSIFNIYNFMKNNQEPRKIVKWGGGGGGYEYMNIRILAPPHTQLTQNVVATLLDGRILVRSDLTL